MPPVDSESKSASLRDIAWVDSLLAVALVLLSTWILAFVSDKDSFIDLNTDGIVYLLLADFYSPFREGSDVVPHLLETTPFPPLYPLVLGALGGGTTTPRFDYALGAVALGASIFLLYVWLRRIGESPLVASAIPLVLLLSPSLLVLNFGIFSEPLYLLVFMSALVLMPRGDGTRGVWLATGLLFGIATLTRTIGICAVGAFLIVWWSQKSSPKSAMIPMATLGLPLAWPLWKALQGWDTSYVGSMTDSNPAIVITRFLEQLPHNLNAFWYHLVRSFDMLGSQYSAIVVGGLVFLSLPGFFRRLRALEFDAIYVALTLMILLFWPYPNHFRRFLFLVLPFFLLYAFQTIHWLAALAGPARLRSLLYATTTALLLFVTLPSTGFLLVQIKQYSGTTYSDHVRTQSWFTQDSQANAIKATTAQQDLINAFKTVQADVPKGECVLTVLPGLAQMYLQRAAYLTPFVLENDTTLTAAATQCPYIVMLNAVPHPRLGYDFYYPRQLLGDALKVLHEIPSQDQPGRPTLILAHYRPVAP